MRHMSSVYQETRRRAAQALLAYCDAPTDENVHALLVATHNLEAALRVRHAPSQQNRAAMLASRMRAIGGPTQGA